MTPPAKFANIHLMKKLFPFGRGDRGSRQRFMLEVGKSGGRMVSHTFGVKVLRTYGGDLTLFRVGTSVLDGSRSFFYQTDFVEGLKAGVQALRDFRHIHKVNKLWQDKRKSLTF